MFRDFAGSFPWEGSEDFTHLVVIARKIWLLGDKEIIS